MRHAPGFAELEFDVVFGIDPVEIEPTADRVLAVPVVDPGQVGEDVLHRIIEGHRRLVEAERLRFEGVQLAENLAAQPLLLAGVPAEEEGDLVERRTEGDQALDLVQRQLLGVGQRGFDLQPVEGVVGDDAAKGVAAEHHPIDFGIGKHRLEHGETVAQDPLAEVEEFRLAVGGGVDGDVAEVAGEVGAALLLQPFQRRLAPAAGQLAERIEQSQRGADGRIEPGAPTQLGVELLQLLNLVGLLVLTDQLLMDSQKLHSPITR